jgi:hypothetical protein
VDARAAGAVTALVPRLTRLDERVLAALPSEPSEPSVRVAAVHHRAVRDGVGAIRHDVTVADVRGILPGLEHLGLASGRGGWWRAR